MKKSTLFFLVFTATAGLFYLYAKGYILADFPSVSPEEAYEMVQKHPDMPVVDVRTPSEYETGHLKGARLMPLQQLDSALEAGKLDDLRGRKFLVYCRSGMRSVTAARMMTDHGLIPVNLRGGIGAWESAGLPVVK